MGHLFLRVSDGPIGLSTEQGRTPEHFRLQANHSLPGEAVNSIPQQTAGLITISVCSQIGLHESTRTGITKHHRLGGLNNRNLLSPVLEAESLRSRCWLAWLVSSEASVLGLQ